MTVSPHTAFQLRLWGLVVLMTCPCSFVCATALAQAEVFVRAESRMEIRVVEAGDITTVGGALRDDVGEALANRNVRLRTTDPGGASWAAVLTTDETGHFRADHPIGPGPHRVVVIYTGDEFHERVEVERVVDVRRKETTITAFLPGAGRLDLDVSSHDIRVTCESEASGARLPLEIRDEFDRLLARGETNQRGTWSTSLRSEELGPVGAGRLKIRTPGDAERADSQTEVPIVRFRATALSLDTPLVELTLGDEANVFGVLVDSQGVLAGHAIGIYAGERHLASGLTSPDGTFAAKVDTVALGEGDAELVARFDSDRPGRLSSSSPPLRLSVSGRSLSWWWLLLPLSIAALLLIIPRRLGRRSHVEGTAPQRRVAGIELAERQTRRPSKSDLVLKALSIEGFPVRDFTLSVAQLEQKSEEGRPIRFIMIPEGVHTLTVSAPGYFDYNTTITVPHRGEWSAVTVRLESVRTAIDKKLGEAATRANPMIVWGTTTGREAEAQMEGLNRARFESLNGQAERLCFGEALPDASDAAEFGDRAEQRGSVDAADTPSI